MTDSSNRLLEAENVGRTFDDIGAEPVLSQVSFNLDNRDSLALIGPSGCGKTTLLLMIAGLVEPSAGRIGVAGRSAAPGMREIGLVLQDYGLFPWKTVRANIELGARIRKIPTPRETISALSEELGITGLEHLYPQQLSGGQRQRVALARALLLEPRLLLLDEPFAALDAMTRERLQQALLDLFSRRKLSFIIVTHHIEEAVVLGRRIMVLGGKPTGIRQIIDNPAFGRPDIRVSDEFFATTVRLRRLIEEYQ